MLYLLGVFANCKHMDEEQVRIDHLEIIKVPDDYEQVEYTGQTYTSLKTAKAAFGSEIQKEIAHLRRFRQNMLKLRAEEIQEVTKG